MFRSIKFACLQIEPKPNFNDALDEALDLAEIAVKEGAKFLCLPEYCGGLLTKSAVDSLTVCILPQKIFLTNYSFQTNKNRLPNKKMSNIEFLYERNF